MYLETADLCASYILRFRPVSDAGIDMSLVDNFFPLWKSLALLIVYCFTVCQVIGMYDYIAQNDDELAFNKGQIINVLNKEDPDWWKGEVNGHVGLFPSNYVKLTTDMDPSQQCEWFFFLNSCLR